MHEFVKVIIVLIIAIAVMIQMYAENVCSLQFFYIEGQHFNLTVNLSKLNFVMKKSSAMHFIMATVHASYVKYAIINCPC